MTYGNDFYRSIADVPPLPADLYGGIENALRRRSAARRRLLALAASLVMIAGALPLIINHFSGSGTLRPEVASELTTVRDFLNGNDLENDLELYAVVEGY